jgi:hypothetical protein
MKLNTESTRGDRLSIIIGAILGVGGAITFVVEGAFFQFAHLALVFAAVLFIFAGILIAGHHKIAQLIESFLS